MPLDVGYGSRIKTGTLLTFNSRSKCAGSPGIIHDRIASLFSGLGCMDDLTTERSFDLQRGSLVWSAYFLTRLSKSVCQLGTARRTVDRYRN